MIVQLCADLIVLIELHIEWIIKAAWPAIGPSNDHIVRCVAIFTWFKYELLKPIPLEPSFHIPLLFP